MSCEQAPSSRPAGSQVDRILELTRQFPKMSSSEIGERVGRHPSYVRSVWHANGIFKRKHDPSVNYNNGARFKLVPIEEYERMKAALDQRGVPM